MQKLWLDLETFCETPIKNGTHAYAEGVEIMLFAWAIDDGPVNVHDFTEDQRLPAQLLAALGDESVLIYAHNSHFDRAMRCGDCCQASWRVASSAGATQWLRRWRTASPARWVHCAKCST